MSEDEIKQAMSVRCRDINGLGDYFIEWETALKLIVLERNREDDSDMHISTEDLSNYLIDGYTIGTYRSHYVINGEQFSFEE